MVKVEFLDIETAYEFVASATISEHSAFIHRKTGEIFYFTDCKPKSSQPADHIPDLEEIENNSDDYIQVPSKFDLDLGKRLVFQFVNETIPDEFKFVRRFFDRRGAYSRLKSYLERKGLLEQWYEFESQAKRKALKQWCLENGIETIAPSWD